MLEAIRDAPIAHTYRESMTAVAAAIDEMFNGKEHGENSKVGFILIAFPFGHTEGDVTTCRTHRGKT